MAIFYFSVVLIIFPRLPLELKLLLQNFFASMYQRIIVWIQEISISLPRKVFGWTSHPFGNTSLVSKSKGMGG